MYNYFSPLFLKQTCIVMAVYQILSKKVTVNGKNQHCWSKHAPFIPATAILWHTYKLLLDLALATLKQCLSVVQSLRPLSLTLGCISIMTVWSPSLPLASDQRLSDLIWQIKQSIHCIQQSPHAGQFRFKPSAFFLIRGTPYVS